MRLSIRSKIGTALVLLGAVMAGIGGLSVWAIHQLEQDRRLVRHTYEVRAAIQDLDDVLSEAQGSVRGYVLTGEAEYLAGHQAAVERVPVVIGELLGLTADNPVQRERLSTLQPMIDRYIEELQRIVDSLKENGPTTAQSRLMVGQEKASRELLKQLTGELDQEEAALMEKRRAAVNFSSNRSQMLVLICTAVSLGMLFVLCVMLFRELGRRERAQTDLALKTRLLQTTFENVEQGLAMFDRDFRLAAWNEQFRRLMVLPADIVAQGVHVSDLIRSNVARGQFGDRSADAIIAETLASMSAGTTQLFELREGGGRLVEVDRNSLPDGSVVSTYTDITERKRVERLKQDFISTVSHELRTPLTSIRGALGLVAGNALGAIPPPAKQMIEIAYANSERLVRLINDILDVERIESGRMEFRPRAELVGRIVEQAVEANATFAAQFNVRFVMANRAEDARAWIDADRLMQIMANLLSNAAKFSPPGGEVAVTVERHNGAVRIAVRDHGPGIPVAFRDKIFGKFAQADASDSRQKGGTGLGLNIVKSMIERMGGSVTFETSLGEGTTFFLDLPEWRRAAAPIPAVQAPDTRQCVLVCEDDEDVAMLLRVVLEHGGFATDVAATARQARELLASRRYVALTLDIQLPDENGLQFFRWLRAEGPARDLAVIFVSVMATEGQKAFNGSAVGVVDWIQKPINPSRLVAAVRTAARITERGQVRILHVEDDPDICTVVAGILAGAAKVEQAADLAEARQKLAAGEFDLVILDITLPDGSGVDLLPLLRPGLPVVIFSVAEPPSGISDRVAAALVKTRSTNEALLATIMRVIGSEPSENRDVA